MADKFMEIPNDDTQNDPFWRLQLMVETFGHQLNDTIKVPKVAKQTNKKT